MIRINYLASPCTVIGYLSRLDGTVMPTGNYLLYPTLLVLFCPVSDMVRDWSKSIGGGGLEQRGGGSSVFEPLVRGGSCNF